MCVCVAVCDPRTHAGAHVQTQDVQPQPQRLSEDVPVSEMAAHGGTSRYTHTHTHTRCATHTVTQPLYTSFVCFMLAEYLYIEPIRSTLLR